MMLNIFVKMRNHIHSNLRRIYPLFSGFFVEFWFEKYLLRHYWNCLEIPVRKEAGFAK